MWYQVLLVAVVGKRTGRSRARTVSDLQRERSDPVQKDVQKDVSSGCVDVHPSFLVEEGECIEWGRDVGFPPGNTALFIFLQRCAFNVDLQGELIQEYGPYFRAVLSAGLGGQQMPSS